ncbi:MAG TPA: methionyl-tRNA formyltransferase [Bacillota bacterium]|nr:methionyl-tRNA formyltransferase [Bacillota bacterium]
MKIVFMGTPDFAVPCLEQLVKEGYQIIEVVTQPDRPKGRKKELTPPPVKVAAQELGIPVFQPEKLRDKEAVDHIVSLAPDLIITAAYGQILPSSLIHLPKYGCINVHASLLPKYRGGAPIHQSIIDGERESGVTIMYMVEKLDAGDILTQVRVPIAEEDTVGSLHNKLSAAGSNLLLQTLPKLIAGELTPIKQDESLVTFARNIQREDEQINWSKSSREIYNQIRGLNPWPVAFTKLQGEVFKIWWAKVVDEQGVTEGSGTILKVSSDGIDVACGEGVIRLLEVQPAGKRRLQVADYVRGLGDQDLQGSQFEI